MLGCRGSGLDAEWLYTYLPFVSNLAEKNLSRKWHRLFTKGKNAATTAFVVIKISIYIAQVFDSCRAYSFYSNHTDVLKRNQTCTKVKTMIKGKRERW